MTFLQIPGNTCIAKLRIHLVDDRPVMCKPHALPYAAQQKIRKEIQEMIVNRLCASPIHHICSPITEVKKNDDRQAFC